MDDTPEHLRLQWLYESIADPDCTGWNCPTCDYPNYHILGLVECERCGFQLDQDRVQDALKQRGPMPVEVENDPHTLNAADPELLAAAKQARDFLIDDLVEPGRTVFWKLVAAINKAEGKS